MARVDPTSPSGGARKARRPAGGTPDSSSDPYAAAFNQPSPAHSASLSPPARPAALSFDSFAPAGGVDPFGPDLGNSNSLALHIGDTDDGSGMNAMGDFFQPPLPFDEAILQSMQSLSDPSGWQDTTLPSKLHLTCLANIPINTLYY